MTEDDKWLDEIFNRTEKEDILINLESALKHIGNLEIRKAYDVIAMLYDRLTEYTPERRKTIADEWDEKHTHWSQPVAVDPDDFNMENMKQILREKEEEKDEDWQQYLDAMVRLGI
jgi:hypothetical protein